MKRSRFSSKRVDGAVIVSARGRADPLAFAGAAYAMIGEAYVALGKNRAWLSPKDGVAASSLAAQFEKLYDESLAFHKQARAQRKEREALLARTLAMASQAAPGAPDAFGELSPERKAEIAALLAEPPVDDVFGIARTWLETRAR